MRSAQLVLLAVALSSAVLGCGSAAEPTAGTKGELGHALVELRAPVDPVRGSVPVELRVLDASGRPVDGLDVTLDAIMPAHGHGASTMPALASQGDGVYAGSGLRLTMAGRWELHVTIAGALEDRATLPVDVR
jgi:hypothetical protein